MLTLGNLEAEILDQEENWHKRECKEALFIRKERSPMNLDNGRQLMS